MDKRKSNYTTLSQSSRLKKILTQMKFAILHDKAGFAGFCILAVIIVISFLSPVVFPLDTRSDPSKIMMQPSLQHILGTDYLGRDIWAQIANGGRELIIFSLIAALIGIILGAFLGAFSAVVGGIFDELLSFLDRKSVV